MSPSFSAGTLLDHYEIRAPLGAGGMGEVYLAQDSRLLRQVALKVLRTEAPVPGPAQNIPVESPEDRASAARFLREAQAASALNHPNICTIYEVSADHDPPFIAMEYVEGETLAKKIKDRSLNLPEILDIALQAADALSDAHAHDIVHRDIKPANIIVNRRGQVKVLDFGLAKKIAAGSESKTQQYLSQAGVILGTVAYMSPEQARGLSVDARTDVWSLGVVLYEMLTGRHPFPEATTADLLAAILRREPEGLRKTNTVIPAELERIVQRTLRKNGADRYASARDLFSDLKQLKRQLELAPVRDGTGTTHGQTDTETKFRKTSTTEEISNLPPHNFSTRHAALIGRENEISKAKDLLRRNDVRLLTLTGVGGTGKTALAKAVATEMLPEFSDGVFFVELSAIAQPELVPSTIARSLGVQEVGGKPFLAALKEFLRDKQLLLVLDNFEQVLTAATSIAELFAAGPLKIMVTSRAVLRLSVEREFVVSPLPVPLKSSMSSVDDLQNFAAVKLFVERARAAKPNFALTEENARSVAEICTQLDGLPLAIELAAVRVKILSAQTIETKLGNRLKLLIGGARDLPARQQTMRAAIEWSYELLTEADRHLFRQLAVFAGGFTLEAAEAVCEGLPSGNIDVLDLITSLVDKSLLVLNRESRIRMLEVIREYAGEALEGSGKSKVINERHAGYFLGLVEEAEQYFESAQAVLWLNRLEEEHDNLRAALRWLLAEDSEKAARLAAALRTFWSVRGHLTEGREATEAALKQSSSLPASVRAKLANLAGTLAQLQGDYEQARKLYEQGLTEARASGDLRQMALSGRGLAATVYMQGDFQLARRLIEEALQISRELNDRFGIAAALNRLGDLARIDGDYGTARNLFEESIAVFRQLGSLHLVGNSLTNLGAVAFALGDYRAAHNYFAEGLTIAQEAGAKVIIAHALDAYAALATRGRELERAARLAGAAEELRQSIGFEIEPADRRFRDAYLVELREALDEATLSVSYEQGRKLSLEKAIKLALSLDT